MVCNVASRGEATQSVDGQTKSNLNGTVRVVFVPDELRDFRSRMYPVEPTYFRNIQCISFCKVINQVLVLLFGFSCSSSWKQACTMFIATSIDVSKV